MKMFMKLNYYASILKTTFCLKIKNTRSNNLDKLFRVFSTKIIVGETIVERRKN